MTGEVLEGKQQPYFDYERLAEEEKYDGYYAMVTSELEMLEMSDQDVIDYISRAVGNWGVVPDH